MLMAEENVGSSLPDVTDSVILRPQRDSWSAAGIQSTNGGGLAQTSRLSLSLKKATRDGPEEALQLEGMLWPVTPVTCSSPPLSFATVRWDQPDPSAQTPPLVTDGPPASQPDFGCARGLGNTSPSLRLSGDFTAELFIQEVREEEDEFEALSLSANRERIGNGSEPCDAANAPEGREKEDSTHELWGNNNEVPGEKKGHPAASDPAVAAELIDIIGGSEDEHLKPEEEQEEPDVWLTRWGDAEDGQTSQNGFENEEEEGGEIEKDWSRPNLSFSEESDEAEVTSLRATEIPAATGPTANPDKPIDPQHQRSRKVVKILERLLQNTTSPTEDVKLWKGDRPLILAADDAERRRNSPEDPEQTEEAAEAGCLRHRHRVQAASRELLSKRCSSERLQMKGEREMDPPGRPAGPERSADPTEPTGESVPDQPGERAPSGQDASAGAEEPGAAGRQEQTETPEKNEGPTDVSEPAGPETDPPGVPGAQVAEAESSRVDERSETEPREAGGAGGSVGGSAVTVVANGETAEPLLDGAAARRLAEQLMKLDGIQRVDVVKHLDKDNDFSRAVGEEYLKFFDFTGQTLNLALRSFLKVVVLIGETQERERVLQHFARRFHQCNPDAFPSSGAVLALVCALMLLNTDLHGQNVGKPMSSAKFVFNLDGMNEGENFSKELLKSLYNSIRSEPLEWAVDEEELRSSVLMNEDGEDDVSLRSKANPFQDVPHDRGAPVVKEGFLQRKLHADIHGKRTTWRKRRWKTFYGVLKGMVLYFQKSDHRRGQLTSEEAVSVHHSLADPAPDYNKKPHVLRLQTADQRVFLFQASSEAEMNSWIGRINLVSALHSSPPFPAAVGSQRRFFRPILPAVQSAHTMGRQRQSHSGMLESFKKDLSHLQKNPPEGKRAKAKDLEEHRVRAEYLEHEVCRYESYIQVLEAWRSVKRTDDDLMSVAELLLFDEAVRDDPGGQKDEGVLKKSHSTPSLEMLPPAALKVKRNVSERRISHRPSIPRWNNEE